MVAVEEGGGNPYGIGGGEVELGCGFHEFKWYHEIS
jgi:hypothetical protein